MPAVRPEKIEHETNVSAVAQVEATLGNDNILRVNVDGVCALRVRCGKGTTITLSDDKHEDCIITVI